MRAATVPRPARAKIASRSAGASLVAAQAAPKLRCAPAAQAASAEQSAFARIPWARPLALAAALAALLLALGVPGRALAAEGRADGDPGNEEVVLTLVANVGPSESEAAAEDGLVAEGQGLAVTGDAGAPIVALLSAAALMALAAALLARPDRIGKRPGAAFPVRDSSGKKAP